MKRIAALVTALGLTLALGLPAAAADDPAPLDPALLTGPACTAPPAVEMTPALDPTVELALAKFDLFAVEALPSTSTSLACGGSFPPYQPGSCSQSCQPCFNDNQCPPFLGIRQRCCTYCP